MATSTRPSREKSMFAPGVSTALPQKYTLKLEQAVRYVRRQGGRRAQDRGEQGRQPVDHCTGPRHRDGGYAKCKSICPPPKYTRFQTNKSMYTGACEGSCACSTCHVIVESEEAFDKIPEASDDENDMLDLAFGLTETSRLGCQIEMTPELDGLRVRLPSNTRNLQAKDFATK